MRFAAFLAELTALAGEQEKVAVNLNPHEQRLQAAQFAALGATSAPAIAAMSNLIQHGHLRPPQSKNVAKWLAATMLAGGVSGGVLPLIRHRLERGMQDRARVRLRAERGI